MTSVTVASGTVYVGLDYHDSVVQVCVMAPCGKMLVNRQCANNASEIVRVVRAYGSGVHATIEACCGSAALADELLAAGWRVSLAHAGYVQRVKQGPDKTDWSDARVLADLLRVGYLPHVWLPPASPRQLRTVVRHRQQLAQQRRTAKQRVTARGSSSRTPDRPLIPEESVRRSPAVRVEFEQAVAIGGIGETSLPLGHRRLNHRGSHVPKRGANLSSRALLRST